MIHIPFRVYKKAATPEKRETKYQVMTKGKRGGRLARPAGHYKLVDRRLKSVRFYNTTIMNIFLGYSRVKS
jgi:hypothetical protein